MRADQKDFQYTAVKMEVKKARKIADLYQYAHAFAPDLGVSKNAIRYYADLTEQYTASRLRRLSKPQQKLHVICFIYHRYQQFMDNLITSFMYHIRSILTKGKAHADTAEAEHNAKLVVDFPRLAKFLKWFPEAEK